VAVITSVADLNRGVWRLDARVRLRAWTPLAVPGPGRPAVPVAKSRRRTTSS